jgi:hypothetical protein
MAGVGTGLTAGVRCTTGAEHSGLDAIDILGSTKRRQRGFGTPTRLQNAWTFA